jgi:hypothetical protein
MDAWTWPWSTSSPLQASLRQYATRGILWRLTEAFSCKSIKWVARYVIACWDGM